MWFRCPNEDVLPMYVHLIQMLDDGTVDTAFSPQNSIEMARHPLSKPVTTTCHSSGTNAEGQSTRDEVAQHPHKDLSTVPTLSTLRDACAFRHPLEPHRKLAHLFGTSLALTESFHSAAASSSSSSGWDESIDAHHTDFNSQPRMDRNVELRILS